MRRLSGDRQSPRLRRPPCEGRFVNIAAELTLEALRVHGVAGWPHYRDALITACRKAPPPFGTKAYGRIYRDVARDPNWMAVSLIQNAQGEGEGSQHLWDLAASTPDVRVAAQVKQHAIDESRHSKAYVAMLDLTFPEVADNDVRAQLASLSPGYTQRSRFEALEGSPYASAVTVDDLIQMNIAEIRTLVHHHPSAAHAASILRPGAATSLGASARPPAARRGPTHRIHGRANRGVCESRPGRCGEATHARADERVQRDHE